QLEEEKEQLASSLFSLTTRFAQIQFRLHQITEAPPNEKDLLLKELEEFAHKGCVDQQIYFFFIILHSPTHPLTHPSSLLQIESSDDDTKKSMTQELREKHEIIINELKAQLNDFESFAFKQVCNEVFPQSVQLEKQQALLEQLTRKLNLQVNEEDFAHTSVDVLKSRVDEAVAEIVNPAKIKGKLVDHLQTQIQDLERFVEFLQESEGKSYMGDSHHITLISISLADGKSSGSIPNPTSKKPQHKQSERRQALALVRRALTLIQMFSITQFGCGGRSQPEETIVDTKSLIDHLKQAVNHVRSLENFVTFHINTETSSLSSYEDGDGDRLNLLVRGELYTAVAEILGNGLVHDAIGSHGSALISPISCLLPRSMDTKYASQPMHPWELFLEYYELKNGPELARSPSRMLTRSFNLDDLVANGDTSRSKIAKHSLLEAIHLVVKDHDPLKRGYDAMLKALICLGLNAGRLSRWIRLISRVPSIISKHYSDASYVARTGMEGVITVLSKLDPITFDLPVDVAVRPFKNMSDAF
uniref:RUN domain-containing protein n=1 Tax=Ciona savignyi TaxID=51511 RepID=H2ZER2_CIOSA